MIKVIHIGFSELFLLTRLNIFTSACIDDSSFRCSPSAYLIRLAGFFVLRASFHQSHGAHCAIQLLLFPRILFLCINMSKNYSSLRFVKLSSNARLSLPGRPTLQGMWTYLCVFRENIPKGTKKSVTEVRLELTAHGLECG